MRARGVAVVQVTPNPKPLCKTNPNNPIRSSACSRLGPSSLFIFIHIYIYVCRRRSTTRGGGARRARRRAAAAVPAEAAAQTISLEPLLNIFWLADAQRSDGNPTPRQHARAQTPRAQQRTALHTRQQHIYASAARSGVRCRASGMCMVGEAGGQGPRVARSDALLHAVAAEVNVIAAGVVEPHL